MLSEHIKAGKCLSFSFFSFPCYSAQQEQLYSSPSRGWQCQVLLTQSVALAQHSSSASLCASFAATERVVCPGLCGRAESKTSLSTSVCAPLERDTRNAWAPLSLHCSLTFLFTACRIAACLPAMPRRWLPFSRAVLVSLKWSEYLLSFLLCGWWGAGNGTCRGQ